MLRGCTCVIHESVASVFAPTGARREAAMEDLHSKSAMAIVVAEARLTNDKILATLETPL